MLLMFSPLVTEDVINAVRRLPDNLSAADSIPTSIFKQIIDVIAPFVFVPEARRPQGHCANVQSSAWDLAGVSRTCCSCRRSAWWLTVSSLCWWRLR